MIDTLKKYLPYLFVLALLVGAFVALQGCSVDRLIRVKTPIAVQETYRLPETLPLDDAQDEYRRSLREAEAMFPAWQENIEEAQAWKAYLSGLTLQGVDAFVGYTGLGYLGLPLAGLAGLLFGQGRLRKNKEKSYNAGIELGKRMAQEANTGTSS
jgi:hypothetical protein